MQHKIINLISLVLLLSLSFSVKLKKEDQIQIDVADLNVEQREDKQNNQAQIDIADLNVDQREDKQNSQSQPIISKKISLNFGGQVQPAEQTKTQQPKAQQHKAQQPKTQQPKTQNLKQQTQQKIQTPTEEPKEEEKKSGISVNLDFDGVVNKAKELYQEGKNAVVGAYNNVKEAITKKDDEKNGAADKKLNAVLIAFLVCLFF